MLYGIDVSHWNYGNPEMKKKIEQGKIDFAMIKVSEGRSYRDPKAKEIFEMCRERGMQIGFYHYCRPDVNNRCELEVHNFLSAVNDIIDRTGISVALCIDWEGDSIGHELWLMSFIKVLRDNSGVEPIVYCSESAVDRAGHHLNCDRTGLWVAAWSRDKGKPFLSKKTWKLWAFHQYGKEDEIDMNVFNGDFSQLRKYFPYSYSGNSAEGADECHCCCACHKGK